MTRKNFADKEIRRCEEEITRHQNAINWLHGQIARLIRETYGGRAAGMESMDRSEGGACLQSAGTMPEQLETIRQYADLVAFRIKQVSTDFTETEPAEGYEAEWHNAKKKMRILSDIYKHLEIEMFSPKPEDREKLYRIIANVLENSITVHVSQTGTARYEVTLFAAPDGKIRHGISIVLEGSGSAKKVVNHSFF